MPQDRIPNLKSTKRCVKSRVKENKNINININNVISQNGSPDLGSNAPRNVYPLANNSIFPSSIIPFSENIAITPAIPKIVVEATGALVNNNNFPILVTYQIMFTNSSPIYATFIMDPSSQQPSTFQYNSGERFSFTVGPNTRFFLVYNGTVNGPDTLLATSGSLTIGLPIQG